MRDHIGSMHNLPLRPVRRSLNEGFQGRWDGWAMTPRQMADQARAADPWLVRLAESALRIVMLVSVGLVAGMLLAGVV